MKKIEARFQRFKMAGDVLGIESIFGPVNSNQRDQDVL